MAKHRKDAAGQSEAAAFASRRIAPHRNGLLTIAGANAPTPDPFDDSGLATGVSGLSNGGVGVFGESSAGPGVAGFSATGTGVLATSSAGTALSVHGKAHFSHSGSASVPQGHSSESVSVAGMSADSLVLVTLQVAHQGVSVLGAVPSDGGFTVHLAKKSTHEAGFAWFVLN
jgi:hypothetical protein